MVEFFDVSNWHLYIAIFASLVNAIILCFMGYKFMQVIQLSGYHSRGYFSWLGGVGSGHLGRMGVVAFLSTACFLVTDVILDDYSSYLAYLGLIFYCFFSYIYIRNVRIAPQKTPLKMTDRMYRAVIMLFVLGALSTFALIVLSSLILPLYSFGAITLTPMLVPVLVPLAHWMLSPLENAINRGYILKAKRKLAQFPDLIKIGITGSFGKTSTKNFLCTILSERYSVCATPSSFNTPLGITRTVLENLNVGHQVFIAEMGARQTGDVEKLCDIVEPKYGILTSIGAQHIATFKSFENVKRAKNELPEYLKEHDGFCVFNVDSEPVRELSGQSKCKKLQVTVQHKADVWASDIITDTKGTNFTLHFGNENLQCNTKLLGVHNISNILSCVGIANALGLSPAQIVAGISKIQPVEHRLQMMSGENGVTILDDTYNASIEGSKRALEVLSLFKDRRKVVITSGLVELGTLERLENYNFGARIAEVADLVVVVNRTNFLSIKQGLLDGGFSLDKIYSSDSVVEVQKLLKELILPNDVILWENDLPDNYY